MHVELCWIFCQYHPTRKNARFKVAPKGKRWYPSNLSKWPCSALYSCVGGQESWFGLCLVVLKPEMLDDIIIFTCLWSLNIRIKLGNNSIPCIIVFYTGSLHFMYLVHEGKQFKAIKCIEKNEILAWPYFRMQSCGS